MKGYWFKFWMEISRPILAKIELICQKPTMPQLSGGSQGGLAMGLQDEFCHNLSCKFSQKLTKESGKIWKNDTKHELILYIFWVQNMPDQELGHRQSISQYWHKNTPLEGWNCEKKGHIPGHPNIRSVSTIYPITQTQIYFDIKCNNLTLTNNRIYSRRVIWE